MSILDFFRETPKSPAIQNTLSYCRTSRAELVKLVDKLIDTSSEISITFNESFRTQYDNHQITDILYCYFKSNRDLHNLEYLLLVPEYGNNLHLHFHGLVRAKPKDLSQLLTWLKRRFGRTTIRSIRYTESYKKYLMKEQTGEHVEFIYIDDGNILRL